MSTFCVPKEPVDNIRYPDREPQSSEPFRTGNPWVGIQLGTLGVEATGKVPIFSDGKLIGQVSVGFLTTTVAGQEAKTLPELAAYFLAVLALGVLAALGLSRRLKRQTFGLELREIAALLQEREAMLHGIREGVLGYDKDGRIVLANDFAQQLLELPPDFVGRPLRQILPPGRLADVVTGEIEGNDLLVLRGDRVLVANRMPIRHESRRHLGWVVTFQDRTESEALKRQLADAIGLADTLRAQSHEFANRLHTLVGLVELGRYSEAIQFVTDVSTARADLTERLQADIKNAKLTALILAKVGAKGRSAHTLEAVERVLASGAQELSAAEVAELTGMSRATAQRYLSHLHEVGRVEIRLRYGSGGRPEHRYRWCRPGEC